MSTKLDPHQIIKKLYSEDGNSIRVDIADTEMAIALDKADDSVAVVKSTDKHTLPMVNGQAELNVLNAENIFIVGNDITIKLKIADKIVNTVVSEVAGQCRVDNIFAETAIIESSSSEVTVLVR